MDTKNTNTKKYEEKDLVSGAKEFECFWLRPFRGRDEEVVLRMRINKKWGGWKLRDGLVKSLDLTVGDTINTEVTVLDGPGLIEEEDHTDLFADGEGADWLLENEVITNSEIVAKVKFKYSLAPVGGLDGKNVWKASLVFIEGYAVEKKGVKMSLKAPLGGKREDVPSIGALKALLGD